MQRKAEQKKDLCRISDNSRKFGLKKASACLEISEALKEGKDLPDIKMENALYEAGIGGNVTAMIFWLKNRLKSDWKDKPVEDAQVAALETAMRALADIIEKPTQDRNIEDFE